MRVTKTPNIRLITAHILIWIGVVAWSHPSGGPGSGDPGQEKFQILSDRAIYITGEAIQLKVFNLSPSPLRESGWSKVYYMELISSAGLSVVQEKFVLDDKGATGMLMIPDDISSGTYYLKGYTRWMRNNGPQGYAYLGIEVVNPIRKSVLPIDTLSLSGITLSKSQHVSNSAGISLNGLKESYGKRESVNLEISLPPQKLSVQGAVSIVRKGALENQWVSTSVEESASNFTDGFIPETRGVSLTGKVIFTGSGLPAPFSGIYISSLGKEKDFYSNYADSLGRFYFTFNEGYGSRELYISATHPELDEVDLYIEQDFCTQPVVLPSFPLKLNQVKESLTIELSENAQIQRQYSTTGTRGTPETGTAPEMFFYGLPSSMVEFDDFIKLPSIEEYFTEVIPQVYLRKLERKKVIRIIGEYPELTYLDPLLMIDGVAIFDLESVLSVSPRLVDRVEIVNAPYIKGNVTFGGIINIITKKGDLGFIDLPDSGLLLNYKMYQDAYDGPIVAHPENSRMPDLRNTILWDPFFNLEPGKSHTLNFYTTDKQGSFEVVYRGYDATGSYVESVFPFTVK